MSDSPAESLVLSELGADGNETMATDTTHYISSARFTPAPIRKDKEEPAKNSKFVSFTFLDISRFLRTPSLLAHTPSRVFAYSDNTCAVSSNQRSLVWIAGHAMSGTGSWGAHNVRPIYSHISI